MVAAMLVNTLLDEVFLVLLHSHRLFDTSLVQLEVEARLDHSVVILFDRDIISRPRARLDLLHIALNPVAKRDSGEAGHLHMLVVLVVREWAWCLHRLFFLLLPQCVLWPSALTVGWEPDLGLTEVWVEH